MRWTKWLVGAITVVIVATAALAQSSEPAPESPPPATPESTPPAAPPAPPEGKQKPRRDKPGAAEGAPPRVRKTKPSKIDAQLGQPPAAGNPNEAHAAPMAPGWPQSPDEADGALAGFSPELVALMSPGPGHERLEPLVGAWTITGRLWIGAEDEPPIEGEGTSEYEWALGGRWLRHQTRTEFMGRTFTGWGLIGYDNVRKVYQGVWADNASTGLMLTTGLYDEATKSIVSRGEVSDAVSGGVVKLRAIITFVDADTIRYEHFETKGSEAERKSMELTYSRVK